MTVGFSAGGLGFFLRPMYCPVRSEVPGKMTSARRHQTRAAITPMTSMRSAKMKIRVELGRTRDGSGGEGDFIPLPFASYPTILFAPAGVTGRVDWHVLPR
jgi:hypothetical protein